MEPIDAITLPEPINGFTNTFTCDCVVQDGFYTVPAIVVELPWPQFKPGDEVKIMVIKKQ